jgi:hypothetical protein
MATAKDLRRIALSLPGTSEAPHFDCSAFKVARIYATLAANGVIANLKFTPDEQALKCTTAPHAFARVPNAWGDQEWTTATLVALGSAELRQALEMAWQHGKPRGAKRRRGYASQTLAASVVCSLLVARLDMNEIRH